MRSSRRIRVAYGAISIVALASMVSEAFALPTAVGVPIEDAAASMGITEDVPELRAGRAVARQLDTENDAELCAAGSIVVDAPLDALADSFRDLSLLRASGLMAAGERIPESATEADFATLPIPEADLAALKAPKRGDSDVKLSAEEIDAIRAVGPDRADSVYRRALLRRVVNFRKAGVDGLEAYDDKKSSVDQSAVTCGLLESLGRTCPSGNLAETESFEYWSVERLGGLKPFVTLTNMSIRRRANAVRIETVQLYASHYCEGLVTSIDLHALPSDNGPKTLIRLTFRTQVDALGGMLGGLKRKVGRSRMVEQLAIGLEQLRAQAPRAIELARRD